MMKRKPKKTRSIRSAEPAAKGAAPVTRARSGRRGWWMRVAAATLVPLVLLGLLELGLRVVGYGHSTRLFLPRTIGGREFLIPNEKFTHGFFPPALARAPLSSRMAADKPEGTYRIFLLGESAAYGDPDPSFGVGRYLEALLEERYPAGDFEVVCVAITAINSHVILPIARECAKHDGDLWVVYMGNNEMIGPYGAGTVFGDQAPGLGSVRAAVALKNTRLGQLMDRMVGGLRSGAAAPEAWEGIAMFSKNPLRHDDPKRLRAYENFKANLDDILSVGKKAGVPIILSTVASNLRDCSPFLSVHSAGLKPAQQTEWQRLFQEAAALEAGGNNQAALALYAKAAALDSHFAELQFRIGTCQLALRDADKAREAFERARDDDALVVRADTRINGIITDAVTRAGADGSVVGVDAVEVLASQTPDAIPGKELFYEHVHFTMAGNYQLARALAGKVAQRLPSAITATGGERAAEVEADVVNRRLAATVWDQKRVWDVALGRISVAPFTSQSSHPRNLEYCKARMKEVDARTTSQSPARDQAMYEAALAREPDDTLVRWNYAQFFERTGRLPDAAKQGKRICERLPDASWPHYFTGSVLARQGRKAEAADYLERALRITPEFPQARKELDQIRKSRP